MNKMYRCTRLLIASTSIACAASAANAQVAGPYTPEQVYFVLHDAIRQTLGIPLLDPNQSVWLSLSTVGSIVNADEIAHINDIANFCPPAKPVLETFGREPKLDAVYERVIESSVTPVRNFSAEYKKAKSFLITADGSPSVEVTKYRTKQEAYVKAWIKYYYAKDLAERNYAALEMNNAQQDWTDGGFRFAVDSARNIASQEEYAAGDTRQATRRSVLLAYRNAGLSGTDVLGAFVSPASSFSPEPSKWATSPGWVSVSFSSDQSMSRYNKTDSSRSGFGGLSLGFVSIGGSAGGKQTTETKVSAVYKLSYEFEIMRVSINRPWFDSSLLFLPQDWTWKKQTNTKDFPLVAVARESSSGRPLPSPATTYNNKEVGCSLLPVDAIIARKRKIVATISKSDYAFAQSSGSASGGGSLFGIFGGAGKQNWSTTTISDDGQNVTFSVQADGISVIGLLSQFVPQSPNPNTKDKWPANAWLPPAKP